MLSDARRATKSERTGPYRSPHSGGWSKGGSFERDALERCSRPIAARSSEGSESLGAYLRIWAEGEAVHCGSEVQEGLGGLAEGWC